MINLYAPFAYPRLLLKLTADTAGQIQHALLHHQLALATNRSFAFDPITHSTSLLPVIWTVWPWRSARIPLGAVASTAVNGFEKLSKRPRAVSASHYASICRGRERVYTIKSELHSDGIELVGGGKARLAQLEEMLAVGDTCVRIRGDVFDPA